MAFDPSSVENHACPEYILPDYPPDVKPDLKMLGVKDEPDDPLAAKSPTSADDPASATPGVTMSVEVKEDDISAACSSSSDRGLFKLTKNSSNNCSGPECDTEHDDMSRHRRMLASEKSSTCDCCGKTFIFKTNLVEHLRVCRVGKPYRCDDCGKVFDRQTLLTNHRLLHSDVKSYSCDDCGKILTTRQGLIYHLRIHTGEKPYKCDDCGKTFSQTSSLVRHRRIHKGRCRDSVKMFTQEGNPTSRPRIHTHGESLSNEGFWESGDGNFIYIQKDEGNYRTFRL